MAQLSPFRVHHRVPVEDGENLIMQAADGPRVVSVFDLPTTNSGQSRTMIFTPPPPSINVSVGAPTTFSWMGGAFGPESHVTINARFDLFFVGPTVAAAPTSRLSCSNGHTTIVLPRGYHALAGVSGFPHMVFYDPATRKLFQPHALSAQWTEIAESLLQTMGRDSPLL